ncbi:uncharacterized protein LOC114656890 [Erpetoichthys calabaricus]|uniref:Uncharacterized LOC114656890 n=1 Tax=Erpetoichthys calabaricus TaxID=27687 RepID=A0A8C4SN73_ERPCA|nr:uncharacterized protein LOC114656890 [Erpetoichthys calabaricus]
MEGFACARIILAVMGLHCVVSGDELDVPNDLEVLAVKSEVHMQWAPPNNETQELFYEVHYRWYNDGEQWAPVPGCTHTEATHCVLSLDHFNCTLAYQTRVRSVSGNRTSKWQYEHQFAIYDIMILQPPNFTVSVYKDFTLITLQTFSQMERKYQKDCYKEQLKLYLHLQRDGETRKMSYALDDFNSRLELTDLQRRMRYCATLELIPNNANHHIEGLISEVCFNTLESGTLEVTVTAVLSVACILLLIISLAIFLLKAFLKRPAQMPEALKSITTLSRSWQPLALDQFQVETIPSCLDKLKKQRASVDSGVSLEPHPLEPETLHLGSGCPLLMELVQDSLSMSRSSGPQLLKETGSSCCSSSNTTVTEDSGVCMNSRSLLDFSGSESSQLSDVRLVVEIGAPAEDCGYRSQMPAVSEDNTYPTWETNRGGGFGPPTGQVQTNKVCLCSKDSVCFLCQMEGLMGRREAGDDRGWQEGSGCNVVIAQTDLTAHQEPPQTLLQDLLTVYSDGYLKKGVPRPSLPPLLDMIHS